MQYQELLNELTGVLKEANGSFLTAYQICQKLELEHQDLWTRLVNEYPSTNPETPMGQGAGSQYSPASFVANALSYFNSNAVIRGLKQESLACEGVSFNGVDPGFTGNIVGIWAIDA